MPNRLGPRFLAKWWFLFSDDYVKQPSTMLRSETRVLYRFDDGNIADHQQAEAVGSLPPLAAERWPCNLPY